MNIAGLSISPRFIRFLFVGVLNTAFGYSIYLLCLLGGMKVEIAVAVATCLGATFNYFTNARLVFSHQGGNRLFQFLCAYAVIYVINVVAIRALLAAGIGPALAQALLLLPLALVAYSIFRLFIFRES